MEPYAFPADLARAILDQWTTRVVGVFNRPPLPSPAQLVELLTVVYLASQETEEGRTLAFTVCCTPELEAVHRSEQDAAVEAWPFAQPRGWDVQEVRRLAVTTDIDGAALWVQFPARGRLAIKGLLNLGHAWADARHGFAFQTETLPHALTIRVEGPGSLTIYQGQTALVTMAGGRIRESQFVLGSLHGIHGLIEEGQQVLAPRVVRPRHAPRRLATEFEWATYTNVLLAIINAINLRQHGGALILAGRHSAVAEPAAGFVRIKYPMQGPAAPLGEHFAELMSRRHALADLQWKLEDEVAGALEPAVPPMSALRLGYADVRDAYESLAASCRFVGHLAGTDGAVVLRTDLAVLGFGAEIQLERMPRAPVYEVAGMALSGATVMDSEQFGMRHRSAMRLCAAVPDTAAFVVSQDGGVSLVFHHNGQAYFRRNISTASATTAYS